MVERLANARTFPSVDLDKRLDEIARLFAKTFPLIRGSIKTPCVRECLRQHGRVRRAPTGRPRPRVATVGGVAVDVGVVG